MISFANREVASAAAEAVDGQQGDLRVRTQAPGIVLLARLRPRKVERAHNRVDARKGALRGLGSLPNLDHFATECAPSALPVLPTGHEL